MSSLSRILPEHGKTNSFIWSMGMVNGGHTLPGNPGKVAGDFMGYGAMEPAQMLAWRRVNDGGGLHRYDLVGSLPLPKSCRWTAAACDHPSI